MKRLLVIAGSIAALSSGTYASADNGSAPTALQKQTAKEHFYKGLKLYDRAEFKNDTTLYEQAYLEFVQAWATYQTDKLLWNLGLSALRTKRYLESLNYFKEYDRRFHVLDTPSHADRELLQKYLSQAGAMTAHATIEADPGERVTIDEKSVGAAPLAEPVDLLPGRHVFKAGAHVADTVLAPGAIYIAKLRTEAAPVSPVVAMPASEPNLHTPLSTIEPTQAQDSTPQTSNTRLWVSGGLGLASAGLFVGGLYFGAKSTAAANDATAVRTSMAPRACPVSGCAEIDDPLATSRSARTTSIVLSSVGVAAAAGAIISWFVLGDKSKTAATLPLIAPGFAGAQWTKSF